MVSSSSITSQLVTFFIFAGIEIICNTLSFFYDGSTKTIPEYDSKFGSGKTTIFALALMG